MNGFRFNAPPGWPVPPDGWEPHEGWTPEPNWPPAPPGWAFWTPEDDPPEAVIHVDPESPPEGSPGPLEDVVEHAEVTPEQPEGDHLAAIAAEELRLANLQAAVAAEERNLEFLRAAAASAKIQDDGQAEVTATDDSMSLQTEADIVRAQLVELNDALLLQQVGIYEYHHPLENAVAYRTQLEDLRERIRESIRNKEAVLASDMFSYNNSLAKGRRMTADFSKLMLRAYNAEADNCVRSLRAGTVATAKKRLESSVETIARLGNMMEMRVSPEYHSLRVEEIELTADYLMKVQEEREAAREERERLREERKAEQELAAERERLNKEREHYRNALQTLRDQGKDAEAAGLEARLQDIDSAIELNDYRAANIRAGYVYVISNIGAFGERVVKIGLTRRLEPLDRIRELGDASVPFPFDVHALYFSDDAVTLENELHAAFAERRLNQVNLRREFFFATPAEVRDVLTSKVGNLLAFSEAPEATQFHQSQGLWQESST